MNSLPIPFALAVAAGLVFCGLATTRADDPSPRQVRQVQAQQQAEQLTQQLHELATAKKVNADEIERASEVALEAFTETLRLEFDRRAERIVAARKRLDALEQQLVRNRRLIKQIASHRLAARLAELGRTGEVYESPQAVLDQMAVCIASEDLEGLIGLLTEDAARELAGCMMLSISSASIMKQVASSIGGGLDAPELDAMTAMEKLMENSTRDDPPPEATAAFKQLMQLLVAKMFSQPNADSVLTASDPLRTSSALLKDHRQFIIDAASAIERLTGSSMFSNDEDDNIATWTISSVEGDVALATSDSSFLSRMELRRGDDGWKISNLFGEDMLEAF